MSPLLSQDSSSVYDPSPEWCAHVRGWWCSLHTFLGVEGKAAEKLGWRVGLLLTDFSARGCWRRPNSSCLLRVCRLFLFKESKLWGCLEASRAAEKPTSHPKTYFLLFLDPAFKTSLSRATGVKGSDPREPVSRCSLKLSGAFLALSESLRLILFSK